MSSPSEQMTFDEHELDLVVYALYNMSYTTGVSRSNKVHAKTLAGRFELARNELEEGQARLHKALKEKDQ